MRHLCSLTVCLILVGTSIADAEDRTLTINVDGRDRTAILHVPAGIGSPAPLLLYLHGGFGRAAAAQESSGFDALADAQGFLVVYPQSDGAYWRELNETPTSEIRFFDRLIDRISTSEGVTVDARRIYIAGVSAGGEMAMRYAIARPNRVAGVGAVIATLSRDLGGFSRTASDVPVPLCLMRATADQFVPFVATSTSFGTWESVVQAVIRNRCNVFPAIRFIDVVDDPMSVFRLQWTSSSGGAEVLLYILNGAGHQYPIGDAGPFTLPFFGPRCREIDASKELWAFFRRQVN